jgi:tetratricopeptide (TPR) repeat protein
MHKNIKLGLALIVLGLSVWQFTESNTGNGIALLFLMFIILFFYVRNEYLLMTFLRLRKEDMDGAEKWLSKIKNPRAQLIKPQEAYYYLLKGTLLQRTNIVQSEKYFRQALTTGLMMDHDKAMAKLNLAGIAVAKKRNREAINLLREAKELDKKKMFLEQIKEMQHRIDPMTKGRGSKFVPKKKKRRK